VKFDANLESKTGTYIGQWSHGTIKQVFPSSAGAAKLSVPLTGLG
jgi:hypothetical protein